MQLQHKNCFSIIGMALIGRYKLLPLLQPEMQGQQHVAGILMIPMPCGLCPRQQVNGLCWRMLLKLCSKVTLWCGWRCLAWAACAKPSSQSEIDSILDSSWPAISTAVMQVVFQNDLHLIKPIGPACDGEEPPTESLGGCRRGNLSFSSFLWGHYYRYTSESTSTTQRSNACIT